MIDDERYAKLSQCRSFLVVVPLEVSMVIVKQFLQNGNAIELHSSDDGIHIDHYSNQNAHTEREIYSFQGNFVCRVVRTVFAKTFVF